MPDYLIASHSFFLKGGGALGLTRRFYAVLVQKVQWSALRCTE
jgi:hypothetical protein